MVTFAKKSSKGSNVLAFNGYNKMLEKTVKYKLLIFRGL